MKETKGITLVALIITIIVMLILAGFTGTIVINSDVITKAKQAKTETANSVAGDQNTVDYFKNKIRETDEDYGDSTIAVTGVYPILYDNGELAFNTTNQESLTGTRTSVVKKYGDISNIRWTASLPCLWYDDGNYSQITSVTFEDRVAPTYTAFWFYNCSNLTTFNNMKNLKTVNVDDMTYMFSGCSSLTSLNLSYFDTRNVRFMPYMFHQCSALTSLDVTSFDTSKVTNMRGMFYGCTGLSNLDLSNFDTGRVTFMDSMFLGCSGLTSIDVSSFNTNSVTKMTGMFYECTNLTSLDISSFNTSNVTDTGRMFYNCNRLSNLDLTNFNTKKITTVSFFNTRDSTYTGMFHNCTNLSAEITISGNVTEYENMFLNAATAAGAQITVNYTDTTQSLVDAMILEKSASSNIVKGTLKVVE